MELFMPSKNILKTICKEGEKPLYNYGICPFDSYNKMMQVCFFQEMGIYNQIIHFYEEDSLALNEETKSRLDINGVNSVIGEAFKNWVDHCPENLDLMIGLFLGSLGVCYGFFDGGDFFKDAKIKRDIENKVHFKVFDDLPRGDARKKGFLRGIFPHSDLIEVDEKKGILYCVQLKENIIAPPGENGSSYFYHKRLKKE